jgi:hypothetical protein
VAVLPVCNRTGDPIAVAGSGLLDRYVFHSELVTVSDVLRAEASLLLQEQGFEVVTPPAVDKALKGRSPTDPVSAADLAAQAGLGPLCLYLEIRRWEPEGRVHVKSVIVDLEVSLIDASARQVLWQARRRGPPVQTPGEVLRESACTTAARKVIGEMLGPLRPDPSADR